jgi:hypothetical protein
MSDGRRPRQKIIKLVGGGQRPRHPRNEGSAGGAMSAQRSEARKRKEAQRKNKGGGKAGA